MKLIGSYTSPFVRKVRIVLFEKKLDYQLHIENVHSADTAIKTFNPLGKVPCLVLDDGEAIFDSSVICDYLDGISPNARLIPQSGRARAAVKTREALADGLCDAAIAVRLELQRSVDKREESVVQRQWGKVDAALDAMSVTLGTHPWCLGINMSLADIAVGTALGYLDFRFPEKDWRGRYANLAMLYDKLARRPSFMETVPHDL